MGFKVGQEPGDLARFDVLGQPARLAHQPASPPAAATIDMSQHPTADRPRPARVPARRDRIVGPGAADHRILEQPRTEATRRFTVAGAGPRRSDKRTTFAGMPPERPACQSNQANTSEATTPVSSKRVSAKNRKKSNRSKAGLIRGHDRRAVEAAHDLGLDGHEILAGRLGRLAQRSGRDLDPQPAQQEGALPERQAQAVVQVMGPGFGDRSDLRAGSPEGVGRLFRMAAPGPGGDIAGSGRSGS